MKLETAAGLDLDTVKMIRARINADLSELERLIARAQGDYAEKQRVQRQSKGRQVGPDNVSIR